MGVNRVAAAGTGKMPREGRKGGKGRIGKIADFADCEIWVRGNFFKFAGSFQFSVSSCSLFVVRFQFSVRCPWD
jgi:hypothetical protein